MAKEINQNYTEPKQKASEGRKDRKMLTLFLILFPSVLIAGDYGNFTVNLVIKAALIFYQFVLLKSFLEDYYKLLN